MLIFQRIAEQKILEAQKQGVFNNLKGEFEPLPCDENYNKIPCDLRVSYKILKNAGFLPPELEIKKEIQREEELLELIYDEEEKSKKVKRLNKLIMKLNIVSKKKVDMELPQKYYDKIETKFIKKT